MEQHDRVECGIDTLLRASVAERRRCVREQADPATWMTDLIDAAERLVIGDLGKALASIELLAGLSAELGDDRVEGKVQRLHGHALAYANRFDEALEALDRAVAAAGRAGDAVTAGQANLTRLHVLSRGGRVDDAIAAGAAALAAFREIGEDGLAARAEANLGVVHRLRGDHVESLAFFDRARAVLGADPVAAAQLDSNRAETLLELDRFDAAETAFTSALRSFTEAGLDRAAAIVEGNLADLASRQGRLDTALGHFERARRRLLEAESPGDAARLQAEEAEVLLAIGLHDDAAAHLADAARTLEDRGLAWEAARACAALGIACARARRYDAAREALTDARSRFDQLDQDVGTGRVERGLAEIALARGDLDEAGARLDAAAALLRDRPVETVATETTRARRYLAGGDLAAGTAAIDAAFATAQTFGLAPVLPEILVVRAELHDAEGRGDRAREDLHAALTEIDRVRGTLPAHTMRTAFSAGHREAYDGLLARLAHDGSPDAIGEAFAVSERSRGRTLLDLMWAAAVSSPDRAASDDDPDEREAARLRAEINALYSRLYDYGPGHATPPDMERWRADTERRERALRDVERRRSVRSERSAVAARPADLAAIDRALGADAALIEYAFIGDELVAFVRRAGTVRLARALAQRERVIDAVERLRFQLGRAVSFGAGADIPASVTADAQRVLGTLHDVLLAPLEPMLDDATHLHIVPAGPLHHVPFAALWDGQYLLERALVTSTPTASVLAHVAAGATPPGADHLVFGAADAAAPAIEHEVARVARSLGTNVWSGDDATTERFAAMSVAAGVIHLAGHGRFVTTNPFASGVRFADRWFTLRDVYALRLARPLVVLSGCDTGACATDAGEELCGLAHAFFAAGADALVMSLWPLHDETAGELMTRFYDESTVDGRFAADRAASALRRAQLEVMAAAPHPLHWASLVFLGRGLG